MRPFIRHVHRLHAERKAASRWPIQTPTILDNVLDQTLNRLRAGATQDPWWRRTLDLVGYKYISPDFLQKPALREWLADDDVAANFKALATDKLLPDSSSLPHVKERLAESYSAHTGEATQLSNGPIDTVIAVLLAGYIASIPTEQHATVGVIQTGFSRTEAHLDRIENLLQEPSSDPIVHDLISQYEDGQLTRILLLRAINPPAARASIQELLDRAQSAGLPSTNPSLMDRLTYWAARLLAPDATTLLHARELRNRLPGHIPAPGPLGIIDALMAYSDGNVDLSLSLLRDAYDPDSRSAFFGLLAESRGAQSAIDWYNQQNTCNDPQFFTAFGWTNWAICSAELERWEVAAQQLRTVEHLWGDSPKLPFIEGAINAACLLPDEYRHTVLQGVPLYPGIDTAHGSAAVSFHARATACVGAVNKALEGLSDQHFVKLVTQWVLWLRLVDPDRTNANSAHLRQNEVTRLAAGCRPTHRRA